MALEEFMLQAKQEWSTKSIMMMRHLRQLIELMILPFTQSQLVKHSVSLAQRTNSCEFGPWTLTSFLWKPGMKEQSAQ